MKIHLEDILKQVYPAILLGILTWVASSVLGALHRVEMLEQNLLLQQAHTEELNVKLEGQSQRISSLERDLGVIKEGIVAINTKAMDIDTQQKIILEVLLKDDR